MLQEQIRKALEEKLLEEMVTLDEMDTIALKTLEGYENEISIVENTIFRSERRGTWKEGKATYEYRRIGNSMIKYYFILNFRITGVDEEEFYNTDVVVEGIDWV